MDDVLARWMRHMRLGEFTAAWRINDFVLRERSGKSCADLPRHEQAIWDGASLQGKRVLVRCYHGLGDTLQFIRYTSLLKKIASEVTVWAQPALVPLLNTANGIDRLMALHDGAPDCEFDVDVEVMELPYVFRATLATLPAAVPYLHAEAAAIADEKMKVGIVWRAGGWDRRRDVPFPLMTKLAELTGMSFYVLQQDANPCEHHQRFKRILPPHADALTTARIMRALDLVISIDSMPAHLAGALALPTWTLLQKDADWRWMNDRHDSPWYPTMRLFRQPRSGEWQPVIAHIVFELSKLAESRTKP